MLSAGASVEIRSSSSAAEMMTASGSKGPLAAAPVHEADEEDAEDEVVEAVEDGENAVRGRSAEQRRHAIDTACPVNRPLVLSLVMPWWKAITRRSGAPEPEASAASVSYRCSTRSAMTRTSLTPLG